MSGDPVSERTAGLLTVDERHALLMHRAEQRWSDAPAWRIGRKLMEEGLIEFVADQRSSATILTRQGTGVRLALQKINRAAEPGQ